VVTAEDLAHIEEVHRTRINMCVASGTNYAHLVAPNKETVLDDFLPATVHPRRYGRTPLERYMRNASDIVFYEPSLLRISGKPQAYYTQDSHWTTYGASVYFLEFLRRQDKVSDKFDILLAQLTSTTIMRKGDLGAKIGLQGEIVLEYSNTHKSKLLVYQNEVRNTGAVRLYRNPEAPWRGRHLILHDSFGVAITDLASALFEEVLFIHTPDFDADFIQEHKFFNVFFVQAERFFVRKPTNVSNYREQVEEIEHDQKGIKTFVRLLGLLTDANRTQIGPTPTYQPSALAG
jgi:hypothetical protein